jgi:1-acyl-sn-glycerol-3-phosphate acyltransferase
MNGSPRVVNWFLRRVFQTVCQIDVQDFKKVPLTGPCILVGNHINFLEAPVVLSHLDNHMFTGMAKKETWDNPLFHFLFNQWGIIPIDRNEIDREAFRRSTQALSQGKILAISPEGTRSKDGRLLQGKPGVTALVLRSQAPLLPVGFFGYENFWKNLKRLRRTEFHMVVGEPFRLKLSGISLSRDVRQAVTDEIMYKIAELLPEKYRGHYQFDGEIDYRYVVSA